MAAQFAEPARACKFCVVSPCGIQSHRPGKPSTMTDINSLKSYATAFKMLSDLPVVLYGTKQAARFLIHNQEYLPFRIVGALDRDYRTGVLGDVPILPLEDIHQHTSHIIIASHPMHEDAIYDRISFLESRGVTIHHSPAYQLYEQTRKKMATLKSAQPHALSIPGPLRGTELNSMGLGYNTDKSERMHDYLRKYEFFLQPFKHEPVYIMELGVFEGGSLQTWREYFQNGRVIGVDMDKEALSFQDDRIDIVLGDLGREEFLESLPANVAQIIIDDASHQWEHQLSALFSLYPRMPKSGVYIVEDIHSSFHPVSLTHAFGAATPPFVVLMGIAEAINASNYQGKDLQPISSPGSCDEYIQQLAKLTDAVIFIEHSCILLRK